MSEERVKAREHELAGRSERVHGLLRIAGGLAGIGLLLLDDDHPSLVFRGELLLWVIYLGFGIATTLVTFRRRPGAWVMPLRRLSFALDLVVLLAQIPLHGYAATHFNPNPALIVPLLGGIKYAYRGFLVGIGGLLLAEGIWAAIALSRFGGTGNLAIEEIALNLVMATAFGVLAAHLAHVAREGRMRADEEATRAEAAAYSAALAHAEVEALHQVLQAGLGLSETDAAEAMVATLSHAVEGDVVLTFAHGLAGPVTVSSHGRPPTARDPQVSTARVGSPDDPLGELTMTTSGAAPEPDVMARLADQIGVALKAARQLDQQARMAERHRELERLKTDFISITSHELRTPLSSIIAAGDTMLARAGQLDPDTHQQLLETLTRNAERLRRLVEDLLIVGRIDAGVLSLEASPTPIASLVDEAVATCDDIDVTVLGRETALVIADHLRVNQILVNLITNAHTHGAPPIEVTWHVRGHDVIVHVIDHGPGVSPEDQERAFERFVQLGAVDKHSEGTGLGLPIARDLARALGGDVELEALEGRMRATLRLPLATGNRQPRDESIELTQTRG